MRLLLAVVLAVLPSRLKCPLGRWLLGWDVHPTAYIGHSLILVDHLSMGPGSNIGPYNVIRSLSELRMGEGASIGTRNWITGFPLGLEVFADSPNRNPSFIMGHHAMITVAHNLDCSDRVEFADYSGLAGFGCAVLTHSVNLVTDRFVTAPVTLGHHTAVMSGCTLMSGTSVASRCIVSAGSVVNTKLSDELTFYRGNPAEAVRTLPATLRYFNRSEGERNAFTTAEG